VISVDFDSRVEVNYSENLYEDDSRNGGDSGKFSYVDDDDNDLYSPICPFDRCVS
jgi:hypothetical protein